MTMLELVLITSFSSLGCFVAMQENYILNGFRNFIGTLLGGQVKYFGQEGYIEFTGFMFYVWKPIFGCAVCMASVWGAGVYSLFNSYSVASFYELPFLILCSCCLNFIIFNNYIKKWLF